MGERQKIVIFKQEYVVFDGETPKYTCNKGTLRPWPILHRSVISSVGVDDDGDMYSSWKSWLE